ncbi:MAG: GNAT family N-acetyltransferase [Acidobacteriota bacterium]
MREERAPAYRNATPQDAADLVQLQADAWRAAYRGLMPPAFLEGLDLDAARERCEQALHGGASMLVIEESGQVVGSCHFETRGDGRDGITPVELLALNVAPKSWRRGHGSSLLVAMFGRLRATGCDEVFLWVLSGNVPARRLYEATGFKTDGDARTNRELTGFPLHEVCYRRQLTDDDLVTS